MVEESLLPIDVMPFGDDAFEGLNRLSQSDRMIPPGNHVDVIRHDGQAEQLQFPCLFIDSKGLVDCLKYIWVGERVKPTLLAANCYKERV